ncbi:MAG: pyruvate, water dikinase regulatory protein [Pseudomonadota bacterium]
MSIRPVFFVSDGTGITAETLGRSLLTQFEGLDFKQTVIPFVDSEEKAEECLQRFEAAKREYGVRPVVFSTLLKAGVRAVIGRADALVFDFFESFLSPLEAELGMRSSHTVGRSHSMGDTPDYQARIEAVNFALAYDDGQEARGLEDADVILIGVSRSGKTPTCLYMAMQMGVKAANYPLVPEDFERGTLPPCLEPHLGKLYGLSIDPERLARIRNERRPGSRYADLENCRYEVAQAERLMQKYGVRWLNSTARSVEEIATKILEDAKLERRVY